jgi:hypothetical protein
MTTTATATDPKALDQRAGDMMLRGLEAYMAMAVSIAAERDTLLRDVQAAEGRAELLEAQLRHEREEKQRLTEGVGRVMAVLAELRDVLPAAPIDHHDEPNGDDQAPAGDRPRMHESVMADIRSGGVPARGGYLDALTRQGGAPARATVR